MSNLYYEYDFHQILPFILNKSKNHTIALPFLNEPKQSIHYIYERKYTIIWVNFYPKKK